jgi:uncharacterized protein
VTASRWKRAALIAGGVVAAAAAGLAAVAQFVPLPGEKVTPAGMVRNTSHYVRAADGTRIAIELWLPPHLHAGQKVPALVQGTRYIRATRVTALGRVLNLLGAGAPGVAPDRRTEFFNARDYAWVVVDVRGTGASFGVHRTEYDPQEAADYAAVLDWIVAQPWSNGRAGAVGVSYDGTSAELMTTTRHPALKAVAPLYSDFDPQYQLVRPGGVFQPAFIETWSQAVAAMDRNDICALSAVGRDAPLPFWECTLTKLLVGGIKPVEEDRDGTLLAAAVAEHRTPDVVGAVRELKFRDSPYAQSKLAMPQIAVFGRRAEIEASGVPMFLVTGWSDAATTDGALARYHDFSNHQTLWIGPFSHGGAYDTDPFAPAERSAVWSGQEQYGRVEAFFAAYLKNQGEPPPGIHYYVMNGPGWRDTNQWPPPGRIRQTLFLHASEQTLTATPAAADSRMQFTVDYSASTGSSTRWHTLDGGGDVVYADRRDQAGKVLRVASAPLQTDVVIAGTIVADLCLAASTPDAAFHVYLEDVAPDGRVTYLTEGVLRSIHHRLSDAPPAYWHDGPYRSFLSADAAPLVPGEATRVVIPAYATAVRLAKGHRIQLALAGADAGVFERVPASGPAPVFTVFSGPSHPSSVSLPVLPDQ